MVRTRIIILCILTLVIASACGAGLVVRRSSEWDRTDWYGKKVIVMPGLAANGIRFSDPNPNESVHRFLQNQLPKLPKFKTGIVTYYRDTVKEFSNKKYWPIFERAQKIFGMTGRVDTLLMEELGTKLQTEYLILPLFLGTDFTSWEFTGIFSYYSAAVELVLFSVKEKAIVFRVRARGYSLGDLEKAFVGASEEVVKVFK